MNTVPIIQQKQPEETFCKLSLL